MTRKTPLLGVAAALTCAAALTPAISTATAHQSEPTVRAPMNNLISLHAMPRGSAQFFYGLGGDLSVKLSVTGVTPGSEHSVDLERTTCPASSRPDANLAEPATVQADATGRINQTIDLGQFAQPFAHGPLALTLRQGVITGDASQLARQGIACTRVPRPVEFRSMRAHMSRGIRSTLTPVSESGNPLWGWASYAYNANDPMSKTGQSVTVTIRASGFVPGSVHAAHIHSGTCASQGGVVVMLPDLTADSRGHLSATDTVPVTQQPQGPLYINLHEGDSNTILDANGNPTLAFRPLLCGDVSTENASR